MSTGTQNNVTVTPGVETSEHAQMKKADTWTTILVAVGIAINTLPVVLENIREAFPQAAWVGTALTIVGIFAKVWNAIGYGRSRAAVKAAATQATKIVPLLLLLGALPAFAQENPEPRFGGCFGSTCFAPTVSFNLMAINLRSGDITTTFDVGPGYGATIWSDKWHKTGVSVSASFPLYEGARRIEPAVVFSFAEVLRLGVSCPTYVAGGFRENARLLLALGVNLWSW